MISIKKLIFAYAFILILAMPIFAHAANDLHLVIGGNTIDSDAPPVIIKQTVYIQADALRHIGAKYSKSGNRSGNDQPLIISMRSGERIKCKGIYLSEKLMVPISDIADIAGFIVKTDNAANAIYVMATIESVSFDGSQLKITTSYPVKYKIDYWKSMNRLIVTLNGALYPSISSKLDINNSTAVNIRQGMDIDCSRLVLDLPNDVSYKTTSASFSAIITASIFGLKDMSLPEIVPVDDAAQTKTTVSDENQNNTSNVSSTPIALPPMPPIVIDDINIDKESSHRIDITVKSDGLFKYTSYMSRNPDKLVIDMDNSILDGKINDVVVNNDVIESFGIYQASDKTVRLSMNLKRVASYIIEQSSSTNETVISIDLPKGASGSIKDKIIFIDPGHGGPTKIGAVGANGIREKEITFAIAQKVQTALKEAGACVFLTRNGDVELDRNLSADLQKRADLAGRNSADFFISIHCNAISSAKKTSGVETYYHSNDPNGRALAYSIQPEIIKATGLADRKVRSDSVLYSSGLAVLRNASRKYNIPAVLIETGFIDHPGDCGLLCNPLHQQKIADSIVRGLRSYIEGILLTNRTDKKKPLKISKEISHPKQDNDIIKVDKSKTEPENNIRSAPKRPGAKF